MAHFAELDKNKIVVRVVVVNNSELHDDSGTEVEQIGIDFCNQIFGESKWVQTSYNGKFRKNYAGIGYSYDPDRNAFIPPKTFRSWILNEETARWEAPVPMPNDGKIYKWDEELMSWVEVSNP